MQTVELKELVLTREVPVERLRRTCDPNTLNCSTSEDLSATKPLIGQERAATALEFGLGIKAPGFNIYVAGPPGTGRTTMVKRLLEQVARDKPVPSDWCYINDRHNLSQPKAIGLPAGRATQFRTDMQTLVEEAQREVRGAFDSEEYASRRKGTNSAFDRRREEIMDRINASAQEAGFLVQRTPKGILTIPVRSGRSLTQEELMALPDAEKEDISQQQQALQVELEAATRQTRGVEKDATEALERIDRQVALYALSHLLNALKGKYQDAPKVLSYLDDVRDDMLNHLDEFRDEHRGQPATPLALPWAQPDFLKRYAVNVLVDNANLMGAPVVVELNPTYNNLFGRIETEAQCGALVTDFSLIRQGALHRANGGYLVLPVEEVLTNGFSWDSLKRALRNQEIVIEDLSEHYGLMVTRSLQPEAIPLDVKVVLIGLSNVYYLLYEQDEDFAELFKVKADFDSQMDRTDDAVRDYAALVSTVCSEGSLKHLDNSALAKVVEYGSRLAEDQDKLSTRFGRIADAIREASYYAVRDNAPYVTAAHIQKAIEEQFYRCGLIQEKLEEMTARDMLMVDVQGERIGQVNGLSVIELGDIAFGHPNRITASVGVGHDGLVDVEREARLGGRTHTKGVLILTGYLTEKYAQNKPLSFSARLVFEQSYSHVDGDSASSAELYALLSDLADLPIKQGIAVTGSVDQKGEVQAIGAVNEKIEGFFEVCKAKGLTGEQGVLIPASNEQNLMLREEVVDAVQQGMFHVWSARTIDEGVEILVGVKAGRRKPDGSFEVGTVNDRVDRRLRELGRMLIESDEAEDGNHGYDHTSVPRGGPRNGPGVNLNSELLTEEAKA